MRLQFKKQKKQQQKMFPILPVLLLLVPLSTIAYQIAFAINCGSLSSNILVTKYFNYTIDTYFEGIASMPEHNSLVPETLVLPSDRELIRIHRTTTPGHESFSYRPFVIDPGYYIAIVTMIETEYRAKNERIFHIKLGDEIAHTVDILGEVGYGKFLHKWIEFDIRDDVVYLNGTLPALNAFNFKNRQLRLVFESVRNRPKIEALMLLKGLDSHQYLKQFLQHEQEKSVRVKQFASEKYRKQPKLPYRPLLATDIIPPPESEFHKFLNKFLTLKSIACIICGILSVHMERIEVFMYNKIKSLRDRVKDYKLGLIGKKKKQ